MLQVSASLLLWVAALAVGSVVAQIQFTGECLSGQAYLIYSQGSSVPNGARCTLENLRPTETGVACPDAYYAYVQGKGIICSGPNVYSNRCPAGFLYYAYDATCGYDDCITNDYEEVIRCQSLCERAGGVADADSYQCVLGLCNGNEDCTSNPRLNTCSTFTGRCGEACGKNTFCYGLEEICTDPEQGICSNCEGDVILAPGGGYACQSVPESSQRAQARRKRSAKQEYLQMLLEHPDCPPTEGVQACAIRGGKGAVECINTLYELESCGGCSHLGDGIDCTLLPHVQAGGVSCAGGACIVSACEPGFSVQNGTCA